MHKKITIILDEAVYDGLYRTIGKGKMSQFIAASCTRHFSGCRLQGHGCGSSTGK